MSGWGAGVLVSGWGAGVLVSGWGARVLVDGELGRVKSLNLHKYYTYFGSLMCALIYHNIRCVIPDHASEVCKNNIMMIPRS